MIPENLSAIITILIGCIIATGLYFAGRRYRRRLGSSDGGIGGVLIIALGIPVILAVIVLSVYIALTSVRGVPEMVTEILHSTAFQIGYIIIGSSIVGLFVKNLLELYETNIATRTSSDFDDKLVHFLKSAYPYVIGIGGFLSILSVLKIDITPLLATGGLIGIIVGFAAQETFGNFISGAMIAADQPFRTGDRIEIEGVTGDVVSVGPRSTRIRTLDNQLVTVPNRILTENMLTNYVLPENSVKVRINIGVGYNSDIGTVQSILLRVAEMGVREGLIQDEPEPKVYFLDFGPSALSFQLLVWSVRYDQTFEIRDFLNTRINTAFREAGVEIPYPQMDLHFRNSPPL